MKWTHAGHPVAIALRAAAMKLTDGKGSERVVKEMLT